MYLTTLFNLVPSADKLCKQFGSRLDSTKPDLDPNCLAIKGFFFEKDDFEKNQQTTRKHAKLVGKASKG